MITKVESIIMPVVFSNEFSCQAGEELTRYLVGRAQGPVP